MTENRYLQTMTQPAICCIRLHNDSVTSLRQQTLKWMLVCVRIWVGRWFVECFIFLWASLAKALVLTRPSTASIQLSTAASELQHVLRYAREMYWISTMETCVQEKVQNLRFYEKYNSHCISTEQRHTGEMHWIFTNGNVCSEDMELKILHWAQLLSNR